MDYDIEFVSVMESRRSKINRQRRKKFAAHEARGTENKNAMEPHNAGIVEPAQLSRRAKRYDQRIKDREERQDKEYVVLSVEKEEDPPPPVRPSFMWRAYAYLTGQ